MRCSQYRNYTEWQLSSMSFEIIGQHCMCQNQSLHQEKNASKMVPLNIELSYTDFFLK